MNAVCTAALGYAQRGWWVFPAHSTGEKKSHKAEKYCDGRKWGKTTDPDEIRDDFVKWPKANVGIATGAESGVVVIEADTPEGHDVDGIAALRALEARHGPLPDTLMAESPTGSVHRYYKHPGIKVWSRAGKIVPGVDVKGDGGMVLAPPSIRPDGKYRWINDAPVADAPAWLIGLVTAKAKPKASNGIGHAPPPEFLRDRTASGRGTSAAQHDVMTREEIELAVQAADPNKLPATEALWFEMTCAIRHELGDDGRKLYHSWAARSPHYVAAECDQKWDGVANITGYGAGTIFHYADQADPSWRDEPEQAKLKAPASSQLDALLSSAADLQHLTFEPLRWVIPELIPEGTTVLAGKPKVGKSWLALDAAIAVASGGKCLGKDCEQGDVLALFLEDSKRRLQRRMTKMLGVHKERWPERLTYATVWPRGEEGIALMREWISRVKKPRLIIIDILQRFRAPPKVRSQETQYAADYEMMAALQALSTEVVGLGILPLHHQRKLAADDLMDTLSGTLGIGGAMDTCLILGTKDGNKFLYARGRDIEETTIAVKQNEQARWEVLGPVTEVASPERAKIIEILRASGQPMTLDQITKASGGAKHNIGNLLWKLRQAGDVVRDSWGVYKLPPNPDDPM